MILYFLKVCVVIALVMWLADKADRWLRVRAIKKQRAILAKNGRTVWNDLP